MKTCDNCAHYSFVNGYKWCDSLRVYLVDNVACEDFKEKPECKGKDEDDA